MSAGSPLPVLLPVSEPWRPVSSTDIPNAPAPFLRAGTSHHRGHHAARMSVLLFPPEPTVVPTTSSRGDAQPATSASGESSSRPTTEQAPEILSGVSSSQTAVAPEPLVSLANSSAPGSSAGGTKSSRLLNQPWASAFPRWRVLGLPVCGSCEGPFLLQDLRI